MCFLDIRVLIKSKFDVVFNRVSVLSNELNEFMILAKTDLNSILN